MTVAVPAADADARWRRCPERDCVWADFGDGVVLYHRPSGKTHLMNDASVALLTDVLAEPRPLAAILAAFAPDPESTPGADFVESMMSLLRRLDELGLVERV